MNSIPLSMLEFLQPPGLLDGNPPSWYAVVRPDDFSVPIYDGQPRAAAQNAEPRVLIMEPGDESDVFVSRYDSSLGYITDAWYPTREAAISDCEELFGDDLGPWTPVPEAESKPERYVLARLSGR